MHSNHFQLTINNWVSITWNCNWFSVFVLMKRLDCRWYRPYNRQRIYMVYFFYYLKDISELISIGVGINLLRKVSSLSFSFYAVAVEKRPKSRRYRHYFHGFTVTSEHWGLKSFVIKWNELWALFPKYK